MTDAPGDKPDASDERTSYRVVFTEAADAQLREAFLWLSGWSLPGAERWLRGLQAELEREARDVALIPGRRNVAPENDHFPGRDVFVLIFRVRRGASAWRVLYDLPDLDGDSKPDTLRVLRVRHGAAARPTAEGTEPQDEDSSP
jgi:plasmid stabilization system protein ParE